MAGRVLVDLTPFQHSTLAMVPRHCPARKVDGPAYPTCAVVNLHDPWVNTCPYWYGTEIETGFTVAEAHTGKELINWVASPRHMERTYRTRCLRCESSGTEATARLRN